MTSSPSWNVVSDVRQLVTFAFMIHAFEAGAIVAIVAGLLGWFMVLRGQTFAGHTFAVVGFPGAAGATYLGLPPLLGFFGFSLGAALVIARAGPSNGGDRAHGQESAAIGTVQAFALACGFLFVSLYRGNLGDMSALLFGSFLGITSTQVVVLAAGGALTLAALAAAGRPLLFASLDPDVAAASGVPVRGLGLLFLLLLGAAAAEASQITGALLVFALLVVPAATAQVLSARPALSLCLTLLIGLGVTWLGLAFAYFSSFPIGFFITTFAFATYLLSRVARMFTAPGR